MNRLCCLGLIVALGNKFLIGAQDKAPPKNFTNSIGIKFVWIPPGNFIMGSTPKEKLRGEDEAQHKVTLTKGFYMSVYVVTQQQWQEVMGNNPSSFMGEKNLPVETVSWDDCQALMKTMGAKDRRQYRLPTEAEWEYACRAGTTTPFHFGETISTNQANYDGRFAYGDGKIGQRRNKTTPVGAFPANAFGLHDMHGNVWQWCQDSYQEYPKKAAVDPQATGAGKGRVMRGGSCRSGPRQCRAANRGWSGPSNRSLDYGLRVCFFPD